MAMDNHASLPEENCVPHNNLLEQILDKSNIQSAWERVKANKGAAGIDGMSIKAFPDFAKAHLLRIMEQIREGCYAPAPVRRVWIPEPNGEQRPLGIPAVLDRVIQQSIAQVLNPIFDVDFSDNSYGFRYSRRAHTAIEAISEASQEGFKWAIDCDLKSFFDTVNHDLLVYQLSKKIKDKRVLHLIGKYLRAGVRHQDGTTDKTLCGVPQGGPLSPLLANIMLDPLDKMIESIQLPFVRYADDFLILAKTKAEALTAMEAVSQFVESKLKLIVNNDKSQVATLKECSFLGFNVAGKRIRRTDKAAKRFKTRIKEITSRRRSVSMSQRIKELNQYCTGWFHYFKIGLSYAEVLQWDQWIRRRIRLCHWKDWKIPRARRRNLIKLGIPKDQVKLASRSRKAYWRMSQNSLVRWALNDQYLKELGVPSIKDMWVIFKYGDKAKI